MPRTYNRKSDAGLIPEGAMREAVMLVIGGGKIRKVATDKGISKSVQVSALFIILNLKNLLSHGMIVFSRTYTLGLGPILFSVGLRQL